MKAKFIAATTAALLMSTGSALAGPVTFSTPINVPNTFAGVYINLLTGASSTTASSVPGWDIGPWGNSGTLALFWNSTPTNSNGGVASTTTGPYLDLAPGTVISSASIFSASAQTSATAAFLTTGTHILGFRFFNEATSAINYGYMSITTNGPNGFPATINSWTFENSGGAITVPGATAGVPEPATWAFMIMGFGAMGAAMRRTRSTTARVRFAA